MDQNEEHPHPPDPLDIEVFLPRSIELIDPQRSVPKQGRHPLKPRSRRRKKLALFLFLATCFSTFLAGTGLWQFVFFPALLLDKIIRADLSELLLNGLSYAIPVMSILLAHEMGHYLQARRYGVPASYPFFIPMPITPFGTMGAVIVQGAGVADRKQMFDIAISGPLAGLVLAIPITYFGLDQAKVAVIPPNAASMIYGDPLILQWMIKYIHGPLADNETIMLNPMLFAGWVGIFITALNLIPIGQLDGGHILYMLIGRRAHKVAMGLLFSAVAYMLWSGQMSYMLIVILLFLFGPKHPPTADDRVPLGRMRIILGWLTLGFIIIGFTPTPIVSVRSAPQQPAPQQREVAKPQAATNFNSQFSLLSFPVGFHEIEGLGGEVLFGGEHASPNFRGRSQIRQCQPESLHYKPPIVTDFLERFEGGLPIDVSLAGCGSIIFGNVNVYRLGGTTANRLGEIFFLDVGVEGVVHHLQVGMIHLLHKPGGIGGTVEEITFKTVEVFHNQRHVG
jgi:Zn-dependent protease